MTDFQTMTGTSTPMHDAYGASYGHEVLRLLDSIPPRGESHNPYDKIFMLDILCGNISDRDLPRFTISILERMLVLSGLLREGDTEGYDNPLCAEDIRLELENWRRYTDTTACRHTR